MRSQKNFRLITFRGLVAVFIFSIRVRVAVIYFDHAISKIKIPANQV